MNGTKTNEILTILDRYGIMTRKQLQVYVNITEKNQRLAIKQLESMKFIKTYKGQRNFCHYITTKGSEYVGRLNFGYVQGDKEPNLATLRHNLMMNDSILESIEQLKSSFPNADLYLTTEREILSEHYLQLQGSYSGKWLRREKAVLRNRIPDYIITINIDGKDSKIAYELELTRKSKKALSAKLKWYHDQIYRGNLTNVCYVYDDQEIYQHVALNAANIHLPIQFHYFGTKGGKNHVGR